MKIQNAVTATLVAGLVWVGAPLLRAQSSQAQRGQLSSKDFSFVEKASRGGMAEVELGQLAQQKGGSQTVRDFGQQMVKDHSQANTDLKQLVMQKGASLPTELSHSERSSMEHLQKLSGAEFDKAYAKDMVKDHKHDLKEFEDAAKNSTDPELKAFAQKTVPILQHHLRMAQDMEAAVKNETK